METISQDLRYAARLLTRKPGFALTAVLTLALGIGANTAIFSVVDAVLLRPLPYPEPDRLVRVWTADTEREWSRGGTSMLNFVDWRERSRSFSDLAVFYDRSGNLSGGAQPENVRFGLVTPGFFSTLGVEPLIGRGFTSEENLPGQDGVAVIGHGLWQRLFGGDPQVLGRTLELSGQTVEVVGVMPPGFAYPAPEIQLWKPFGLRPGDGETRGSLWVYAFGRLGPGVALDQAQLEMTRIAADLERQHPDDNHHLGVLLEPLGEVEVAPVRPALLILWGAVGCVLLIACANTANLLLARASSRSRELSLRAVLGAGRMRLVRQLMTENLLLSTIGGVLGAVLAIALVRALPLLGALEFTGAAQPALDGRMLAFSGGLVLLTALLFGLVPALRAAAGELEGALRRSADQAGGAAGGARGILVAVEVALALVLTLGAGLLVKSFERVLAVEPGFDPDRVLTLRIEPPRAESAASDPRRRMQEFAEDRARAATFYDELLDSIRAIPGVRDAAAANRMPLSGNMWGTRLAVEGRPRESPEDLLPALARVVTPGYFRTLGVPLAAGRDLEPRDDAAGLPVAVVNRALAEALWPDADPIGQRVSYNPDDERFWYTVVGVVGNVRESEIVAEPGPVLYTALPQSWFGFFGNWGMDLVVRGEIDAVALAAPVRERVRAADADLPVFRVRTLAQAIGDDTERRRWMALLLSTFSSIALALAAVGVYGLVAFSVSRRTREFGVRVALGARRRDVLALVLGQGTRVVVVGIGVGLAGAYGLTRYLESLMFEVSVTDSLTWIAVSLLLVLVALVACWVPARQATRVDPLVALRDD